MSDLNTHHDEDGVLTVRFDQRGRQVNTITREVLNELSELVTWLERDQAGLRGVIFTSAKPGVFVSGADLYQFRNMNGDELRAFLVNGQTLFERINRLPIRTVAALNGHCLGGGLELALACDATVAANRGDINLGFPEIKLGILPGWGGTTRLTHLLGTRRALQLILTGKVMSPRRANRLGLIDEVVRPEALVAAAHRLLDHPPRRPLPPRIDRAIHASRLLRNFVLRKAKQQSDAISHGNYPATDQVIRVIGIAAQGTIDEGLRAEREAVEQLMTTDACRNLLRLFFLKQDVKHQIKGRYSGLSSPVHHAAVIGGGTMGAGITHALVRAGVPVRLVEVDAQQAAQALRRVDKLLTEDLRSKRISTLEKDQAMHHVSPCTDWTGLSLADVVIEAVTEDHDIKRDTYARLARLTRPDAVLASNTSSLPIEELAGFSDDPKRVIGLHFFNPVARMPLVEVVKTARSDPHAVAVGAALAMRLGKIPIVVNDGPGFLVNRLLIPYLAEAITLSGEGVPITTIDTAMQHWGMPMGPFELIDLVGLPVACDIFRAVGPRLTDMPDYINVLARLTEQGWHGKRVGKGFYTYGHKRRWGGAAKKSYIPSARLIYDGPPPATPPDHQAIQWRLVTRMIIEAVRVLDERVVTDPDTIDLATVLGLGLAPFRGGLMSFARTTGSPRFVQIMNELAHEHGPRFAPPSRLAEMLGHTHDSAPQAPSDPSRRAPGPQLTS